jgi:RHS repeat-associated protein
MYNAFGKLISKSGTLADFFRHRFSTKYFDTETSLYYYGYRFYHSILMRWLNRDPIEEDGGLNLYGFCGNNAVYHVDYNGTAIIIIKHLPGAIPPSGWPDTKDGICLALTIYKSPSYDISEVKCPNGKITFNVEINPPNTYVDIYFRSLNDYMTKMYFEKDHVSVARRHEQAIHDFKKAVEAILDCPKSAREALIREEERLKITTQKLKEENAEYDKLGGSHVLLQ